MDNLIPVDAETFAMLEARRQKWAHESHVDTIRLLCEAVDTAEAAAQSIEETQPAHEGDV